MAALRPPHVPDKPVPVFADRDLPRLERACAGRSFGQRRDTAIIAVFTTTGIRLSELAGIRYDSDEPRRSDVDLWHRQIIVHGKGRTIRTVKISYGAARVIPRYGSTQVRPRARPAEAARASFKPRWRGRRADSSSPRSESRHRTGPRSRPR